MSFDSDYGPYNGHPSDPRYDDSEDLARDKWECDETYLAKIGDNAVEEILYSLQHGKAEDAKADLIKTINAAWDQHKNENKGETNEPDTFD